MLRTFVIALLISVTGWGQSCPLPQDYTRYGRFARYVYTFVNAANKRNVPINLNGIDIHQVSNLHMQGYKLFGICLKDQNMILIDRQSWAKMDDALKEELIWHEMGHCVLNRKHWNYTDSQSHPISIMHEGGYGFISSNGGWWYEHRQDYLDELFTITSEKVFDNSSGFVVD